MALLRYLIFLLLPKLCMSSEIIYTVKEEQKSGTFVGDISTNLQLIAPSLFKPGSKIRFKQLVSPAFRRFRVSKAGKLYTAQVLDAESLCIYNRQCFNIVKIGVHQAQSVLKILKVKVIIEDINDHQPQFPLEEITLQFSEGDGSGMRKSIPNAIDKDVHIENRNIRYYIKQKEEQPFSLLVTKRVDGISSLILILDGKLDREVKDKYNLEVIAENEVSPYQQGVLDVKITITDENDNIPAFSQNVYNVSINHQLQSQDPILTISASDLDAGNNGVVSYYFSPITSELAQKQFSLNQNSGEIFFNKLNKIEKNFYELYIEARDSGTPPLSSITTVMISVVNHHNNPPVIDVDFVSAINGNTATILEDVKVGSFIAYVMVTDNDAGHNGEVKCHIKDDTFKLQSMGSKEYKIVLKKAIDRETQEHYHFTVSCEDKGLPALKTDKDLSIQVLDVNDVKPHFTKDTFKFVTYENDKANFPIGFINATDPDIGKGGELSYYLRTSKNQEYRLPFQIINSGFISTNQSLDREHRDFYEFEVFVKDNGTPSLNNTVNVEVEVLDRNDNAPYFTFPSVDPFTLDVHYHPQSKNDITVLKASDIDSHMNAFLRYEIMSGNERQLFKLDSFTGVLSYSRTVYQNDAGSYHLEFVVKDSGTPVLSARTSVSLTLTVSNKTSPMFTAVHLPSDNTIDATLLIIIVVAAVIVSIAIVVSITLCIVRCNNVRNSSAGRTEEKQAYQCHNEMRQLIYQGNNSVAVMSGNRGEVSDRYSHSRSHYYPEDWKTATINRTLVHPLKQNYSRPIEVTTHEDQSQFSVDHDESVRNHNDFRQSWIYPERLYEEIPANLGMGSSERDYDHDRYVKPPARKLPSPPESAIF